MFSSAEKTTKPTSIARKQAGSGTFFRKAGEESFFGAAKESQSFFGNSVQAKLSISQPDDPYEREADRVAETVMSMPESTIQTAAPAEEDQLQMKEDQDNEEIQPKLAAPPISSIQCKKEDETVQGKLFSSIQKMESDEFAGAAIDCDASDCSTVSRKSDSLFHSDVVQRSGRGPPASLNNFENTLNNSSGGGSALPESTRTFMESRFNADFSGVRIHTGSTAEQLSSTIHAQAFTHGNNIYFNSGKYSPETSAGGTLLAHELTHTVQQGASKTHTSTGASLARKAIQRSAQGSSVPQLNNAVAKAKSQEGKVNAGKEGADGYREGWTHLLDYFKTTLGEDKVVSNGQAYTQGAVAEDHIKKRSTIQGMPPANPRPSTGGAYMRDAMPSWCGIFVFWALNKAGVPMAKWELGGRNIKPEAVRPPGSTPQVGDIAYRDQFSHFAIVEKVSGSTVTTVNGNTAGEDNLGAQVQTRDHPLSKWTAFFDPLLLKTGALQNGEAKEAEKPKTLRELRKELFHVDRKEDDSSQDWDEKDRGDDQTIQTKPALSDTVVTPHGELVSGDERLQSKEEDGLEEGEFSSLVDHSLQRKNTTDSGSIYSLYNCDTLTDYESTINNTYSVSLDKSTSDPSPIQKQEEDSNDGRGPPVQLKSQKNTIQCSWFDSAVSFVNSAINFVAEGLEAGKRLILAEARDFAMAIPGYRALRVVLGEDPITGEDIARNGHTFIEAAFDIIPGGPLLHQKLNELGALDQAALWVDNQIAAVESLVSGVISSIERFWNGLTLERLASPRQIFEDAGNIIYSTIQGVVDFAVKAAKELLETVKRFLIEQLVSFIKTQTSAYPLLRLILGQDPVTDETVVRNGTNILEALLELGGETGREQRKQMQETGTFAKVAGWIDEGIAVFDGAYEQVKAGFLAIWNDVSIDMLMHPLDTFNRIYETFAAPVTRVLDFAGRAAIAILTFIKEVLMQRLSVWARTVRGYHLVTVIIEKDPFTNEVVPRTMENLIRGFMSLMEGGEEQHNQLKESGAIERTTAKINAAVARLNMTPVAIVQLFTDLWDSFSLNDLADPIAAFRRILDKFGQPIARLVAFVVEIIRIVIEVILQVMNFPSDLIANIITRAMLAINMIKADPVGFLKNLLRAIKQGFTQFFDNILKHLLTGLTGWLLSELKDAGVAAPADFSLQGIIAWVLQVLDITMEKIWEKLAAHPRIGPQKVAKIRGMINTLDGIWTFIKDVQERGIAAIWDKIQEQLSNLWNTVLDAVKNWVMEQIVNKMVTKLLSMLDPTGIMAVVNSAIALYSAIQSFIKYLQEMLQIVNSFVEGVVEIASGDTKRAADALENTLGRSMPVVIGFLANQVGLSGVGKRIGELIESARKLVDEAITWLVNKAVDTGFALFDRALAAGQSAVSAVISWAKGLLGLEERFTTPDHVSHRIYFVQSGQSVKLKLNPTPAGDYSAKINEVNVPAAPNDQVAIPGSIQVPLKRNNAQVGMVAVSPGSDGKVSMAILKAKALEVAAHIDGLIQSNMRTRTDSKTEVQDQTEDFSASLRGLGSITTHLLSSEPEGEIPVSAIPTYGALHLGFAKRMDVKPLTRLGVPGTGVSVDSSDYSDLLLRRETPGGRSYYIAGHLLNNNVHGSGSTWENLTPIAQRTNAQHESRVESKVKEAAEKGLILHYTVDVDYSMPLKDNLTAQIVAQPNWETNSELAEKHKIITAEAKLPTALNCTLKQIKADGTDLPTTDAKYDPKYNISGAAGRIDNTAHVNQSSLDIYYLTSATAVTYKLLPALLQDAAMAILGNTAIEWNTFYTDAANKVSIDHLNATEESTLKDVFKKQQLINEERARIEHINEMQTFASFSAGRIAYTGNLLSVADKNNLETRFNTRITEVKNKFISDKTTIVQNLTDRNKAWGEFRVQEKFVARVGVLSEAEIQNFKTNVFDVKINQLNAAGTLSTAPTL